MSEIVLAVPERALAVFPRLAPMDGRQHDDECRSDAGEIPGVAIECRAAFNHVPVGCVVPDPGRLAEGFVWRHDVRLGGMQVAARRVDTQRPAGALEYFPRRESQRVPQKMTD